MRTMGLISELKLAVPWGHIAAKAWGSHQAAPVLCLHGWLNNANSFDRLIPLLPKDFHYVAMDFGGHGLSSHYSQGFPYYHQNFVSEVRRVAAALKWNRFSLLGHSFGGTVGGMFSCIFPEMVDKLILLDALPVVLDTNEMDNLLTYKRRAIEHVLQVEASRKPAQVVSPEEMLQWFLKNNSHVGEENGKHLLQRGTTQAATGVWLNRDRRITLGRICITCIARRILNRWTTGKSVCLFLRVSGNALPASGTVPTVPQLFCRGSRGHHRAQGQSTASTSSARSCLCSISKICRPASCSSK
ncbi:serine hydrolase-like protein 2 isoform X3 [Cervus canadensis]|uniref:serine hydrolase-like protein 2 isoform X3 n=1 Tax=Cervus canadensis TaxID=1574408 RepID=UPI001CA3187E|nr:serine hydrolase-like protein 2 isoform X3 [Cervus canadensis]